MILEELKQIEPSEWSVVDCRDLFDLKDSEAEYAMREISSEPDSFCDA